MNQKVPQLCHGISDMYHVITIVFWILWYCDFWKYLGVHINNNNISCKAALKQHVLRKALRTNRIEYYSILKFIVSW